MKYTRYNMNKGKSNSTTILIFIVGIILVSILLGSILSILMKDTSNKGVDNKDTTVNEIEGASTNDGGETTSTGQPIIKAIDDTKESKDTNKKEAILGNEGAFVILQCGAFSNQENANSLKGQLAGFGEPFIVKVGDISKVVLGVYSLNDVTTIKDKLENANMEFSSNNITLSTENKCDKQISLVLNGNLKIISEIEQDGASSVKTKTIKEWLNTLAEIDKSEKNYNDLNELKDYTSKLPEAITKENLIPIKEYLYSFIIKFDEGV
ncbi:hypothetical protein SH2C18_06100 [Clostridium sediminicola]|uniref:SPOR domain-containing protein n=1 Tax=Clostridium sediminicola TaxID=3114879 RepID=UPI0031F22CE6